MNAQSVSDFVGDLEARTLHYGRETEGCDRKLNATAVYPKLTTNYCSRMYKYIEHTKME